MNYKLLFLGFLLIASPLFGEKHYDRFIAGNPTDVVRATSGLLVLQGGGTDVDENYVRMGKHAGGGDFVVLRATGSDAYNTYVYDLCSCDSVETIVIKNREAASDPIVIEQIRNAEAIWIAGGDQSNYVRFWKDTPVEDAIHFVARKPAPIGGTSAGMAVMSEFVYSAMSENSLTSVVALSNPFHTDVTLEKNFLIFPKMEGILTDQHLAERDRIGRTVTLLARLIHDGWTSQAKAIAADRETSLHVDPVKGTAEVFSTKKHSNPYVYFLKSSGPPEVCKAGVPLTFRNVEVYRVGPGGKFDLNTWTGQSGISYTLSAVEGKLTSSRGQIY